MAPDIPRDYPLGSTTATATIPLWVALRNVLYELDGRGIVPPAFTAGLDTLADENPELGRQWFVERFQSEAARAWIERRDWS